MALEDFMPLRNSQPAFAPSDFSAMGRDAAQPSVPVGQLPPSVDYGADNQPTGRVTREGRPILQNGDGSVSTERTITVQVDDLNGGKPTNIPTIWNGKPVSQDEAIANAVKSGQHFTAFNTVDDAVSAAKTRSNALGNELTARMPDGTPIPQEVLDADKAGKPFTATQQPGETSATVAPVETQQPPPSKPASPLKWDTVQSSEKYQALDSDAQERIRNRFFIDNIAPKVPTDKLDTVKASFDAETKLGAMGKIWKAAKGAGTAVSKFVGASIDDSRKDSIFSNKSDDMTGSVVEEMYRKLPPDKREEIAKSIDPKTASPAKLAFLNVHGETNPLLAEAALNSFFEGPGRPGPTIQRALERIATPDAIKDAMGRAAAVDKLPEYQGTLDQFHDAAVAGTEKFGAGILDAMWGMAESAQRKDDAGETFADEATGTAGYDPMGVSHMSAAGLRGLQELARMVVPKDAQGKPEQLQAAKILNDAADSRATTLSKMQFDDAWDKGVTLPWMLVQAGQQAPQFGMTLASIAVPPLAPITLPAMGLSAGGNQYQENREKGVNQEAAANDATLNGAVEVATEGLGFIVGKAAAPVYRRIIEAMPESTRRAFAASVIARIAAGAGTVGGAGLVEGSGESIGQYVQDTSQEEIAGRSAGDKGANARTAFFASILPGAGFAVHGAIVDHVQNSSTGAASEAKTAVEAQPAASSTEKRAEPSLEKTAETEQKASAKPADSSASAATGPKVAEEPRQSSTSEPVNAGDVLDTLDSAAHAAATSPRNDLPEPTDAQKKAGNYQKGHDNTTFPGLDISIENPQGSVRRGTDPNGNAWENTLESHYGYIRGTVGKDKDHVDVFVKPESAIAQDGDPVFVIDQKRPGNGHFDEHKVMLGFATQAEAEAAYKANYAKGWDGIRATTATTFGEFKTWLKEGDTTKEFANANATVSPDATAHPPASADAVAGVNAERRADTATRKRVSDMSADERANALLTDDLTGLPNRRAYDEAERLPVQSRVDLDGFKGINDTFGHDAGDAVLKAVGNHLQASQGEGRVFRIGGDEFPGEFASEAEASKAMEFARQKLASQQFTFELPDGSQKTISGVGFSYGIGQTSQAAESALIADKAARAAQGVRARDRALSEGNARAAQGNKTGEGGVNGNVGVQPDAGRSKAAGSDRHNRVGSQAGGAIDRNNSVNDATTKVSRPSGGDRVDGARASDGNDQANGEADVGDRVTKSPDTSGDVTLGTYGVMPSKNNNALVLKKQDDGYALYQGKAEAIDADSGEPITYASVDHAIADLKAELKRSPRRFLSNKQGIYLAPEFKAEKAKTPAAAPPADQKQAESRAIGQKLLWDGRLPSSVSGERNRFADETQSAGESVPMASDQGKQNDTPTAGNGKSDTREFRGPAEGGVHAIVLRKDIADVAAKIALPIRVTQTFDEATAFLGADFADDSYGAYHNGKIVLIADNIPDVATAQSVLAHELQHAGLVAAFPNERTLVFALENLALNNENVRQAAKQWRADFGDDVVARIMQTGESERTARRQMTLRSIDEAVAELAGQRRPLNGFHKFMEAVQRLFRRIGLNHFANVLEKMTDAEAMAFIARSSRALEKPTFAANVKTIPATHRASSVAAQPVGQLEQHASGPIDATLKHLGGKQFAKYITLPIYRQILGLGRFVPEKVKAGLVADYGLPEPYIDERDSLQARQINAANNTASLVERMGALSRAQSAIAYQWMTNNDALGDALLSNLPADQQATLKEIKQLITDMGKEAVELGQLSADSYEKNKDAYLHRSYRKFELEDGKQDAVSRARAIKVLGQQYKGRGLRDEVKRDVIGHVEKGEKFTRYENRDKDGRIVKVHYQPVGKVMNAEMAAKYGDYRQAGTWEARYLDKPGVVGMWRDFTPDELNRMGEIDEIRYSVAKTLHMMVRDVEIGKFFKWIGSEYAKDSADGLKVAEVSTGRALTAFKPDEWAQVPSGNIPGTNTPAYGAIAGKYVPAAMWNDLRQVSAGKFQPFGDAFDSVLKFWKLTKTAYSPGTHMNNIVSNFLMADYNDVSSIDVIKSLYALGSNWRGKNPEYQDLLKRYEQSGAEIGSYILTETQRATLEPLIEQLRKEVDQADSNGSLLKAVSIVNLIAHGQIREGASRIAQSRTWMLAKKASDFAKFTYQSEDTIFRLAAFIKGIREGMTDEQAGKFARDSFLNYSINAPWIQNARATAFPFIAFAYRAAPMLAKTVANKPWKMFKYWALAGGLNALAYSMLGGGDDREKKERAILPDEKTGKIWGIFPRLLRMPWNDKNGNPVFLDIRRWVPVGDILDTDQNHSALPLPQTLIPGGPLMTLAEVLLNKSSFTGKEITLDTDTPAEKAAKLAKYLYQSMAPNNPVIPFTYSNEKIGDARHGKTDVFGREQSVPEAAASSIGIKLAGYPADVLMKNIKAKYDHDVLELEQDFSKSKREYQHKGMSAEDFAEKQKTYEAKRRDLAKKLQEKLR